MNKTEQKKVPKLRFPGFDSEWTTDKLQKFIKTISSGKSNTFSDGLNYPIYGSTGEIRNSSTYDYEGDHILIARVGANAGKIHRVHGRYKVSDNTLILTLLDTLNTDFTQSILIRKGLDRLVSGSGQPLVTGGQLKKVEITIPAPDDAEVTYTPSLLMESLIDLDEGKHKFWMPASYVVRDPVRRDDISIVEFDRDITTTQKALSIGESVGLKDKKRSMNLLSLANNANRYLMFCMVQTIFH